MSVSGYFNAVGFRHFDVWLMFNGHKHPRRKSKSIFAVAWIMHASYVTISIGFWKFWNICNASHDTISDIKSVGGQKPTEMRNILLCIFIYVGIDEFVEGTRPLQFDCDILANMMLKWVSFSILFYQYFYRQSWCVIVVTVSFQLKKSDFRFVPKRARSL